MTKSLMLLLALVTLCSPAWAEEPKICGAPVMLNDGWSVAIQAEAGLDAARLCELDSFIAQWPEANIHAVVVVRDGKLVMERYFAGEDERWGDKLGRVSYGPEVKHDLRSISKSATSLLVGIARSEGKFPALDSGVFDAFPDYADLRTPDKARITFRDLLTMSSGLAWDEDRPWLGRSLRNGGELTWAAGVGLGGQRLFVVPALDLVVMINAGHYRDRLQGVIPAGIFNRIVLPAVKD
jgi:CubicO group peptidase (beta-lactamase class C family)